MNFFENLLGSTDLDGAARRNHHPITGTPAHLLQPGHQMDMALDRAGRLRDGTQDDAWNQAASGAALGYKAANRIYDII